MQLTLCVITGFIALSAASPAAPINKQGPPKPSAKATPAPTTGISTPRHVAQAMGLCIPCRDNEHCHGCRFECNDCDHLMCSPQSSPPVTYCVDVHALALHPARAGNSTAGSSKSTAASLFFRTIEGHSDKPRGWEDPYQGPYQGPPGPGGPYSDPPAPYYDPPTPEEPYYAPPGPPDSYNVPPCAPGAPCPPGPPESYNGPHCPPGAPCPPGPPESYNVPPCPPGAPCPPESYGVPPPPPPPCPSGAPCPPGPPESYGVSPPPPPPCPSGAPCPPGPTGSYSYPPGPYGPYDAPPKRGNSNGYYGYGNGQPWYGQPWNGPLGGRPLGGQPWNQPPVSNGPVPYFEFNESDCMACTDETPCTGNCTWQFDCSNRLQCFYNNAREVVELCYEQRTNC